MIQPNGAARPQEGPATSVFCTAWSGHSLGLFALRAVGGLEGNVIKRNHRRRNSCNCICKGSATARGIRSAYQRVDVICFNYDGEGTALAWKMAKMATMYKDEVEHLITMVIGVDAAGNPIGTALQGRGGSATPF